MAIRMDKPWRPLTTIEAGKLTGELGVYQIANASSELIYIGFAGGRSLFGLRGELQAQCSALAVQQPLQFRCEVNMQYTSRYLELLMVYQADHGELPMINRDQPPARLGRLHPA